MEKEELVEIIQVVLQTFPYSWVLFSNGTIVLFRENQNTEDIQQSGIEMIEKFGPVHAGGPAGDFGVDKIPESEGWMVSGHGEGMFTFVHPNELTTESPSEIEIGLYGRNKRNQDSEEQEIIHIHRKS